MDLLAKTEKEREMVSDVNVLGNKVLLLIPRPRKVILEAVEWLLIAYSAQGLSLKEIAEKVGLGVSELMVIANKLQKNGLVKFQDKTELTKTPFSEAEGKYVPPVFWKTLKAELSLFLGPITETLIDDEIEDFGESKETFPYNKVPELIENLANEIDNPDERLCFQKKMLEVLKKI